MEFKGSKGNWGCVFTSDKSRAVRNKGGLIAKLIKPSKYSGQDERYDEELEEARCNQRLIAAAPDLLEALSVLLDLTKSFYHPGINHARGTARNAIEKALK